MDIDFYPNQDMIWSGVCILKRRQIFVIVCFNHATKRYDGIAVFRSREITAYRYWDKKRLSTLKKNNCKDFLSLIHPERMKTFYSGLKSLPPGTLIAVFTGKKTGKYIVGKVHSISRDIVTLRLIDEKARWTQLKTINIREIDYFSYGTQYEQKLAQNAT